MYGIYQVRVDDTLDTIANEIGTAKEELMQINGIVKDMALRPGSFIIVPRFDNNYIKYKVKKGDNIYALAEKNNVDYKSLLKLNGLDEGDYIYPDQIILIPNNYQIYITEEETLVENNPNLIVKEEQIIRY